MKNQPMRFMLLSMLAVLLGTSLPAVAQTDYAIRTSALSEHDANAPIGFGAGVTGSGNANPITVTTRDALITALSGTDAQTIYVDGTIEFSGSVNISGVKNKTVIGLPGATLSNPTHSDSKSESGIMTLTNCQNIIIRNLTFQGAGAYDIDGYDNLTLFNSQNIWIDHCDFQDGVDGNLDCNNGSDNICVSWCRFSYKIVPWSGGSGGSNDHRFSNLWGSGDNVFADEGHLNTTFVNCWWDEGCKQRMPRIRFGQVHLLNCLYNSSVADYCIGAGYRSNAYVENCYFDTSYGAAWQNYASGSYTDYNITLTGNYGADDEKSQSGSISYFTPSYDYTAYNASDVKSTLTAANGAGATLQFGEDEEVVLSGTLIDFPTSQTGLTANGNTEFTTVESYPVCKFSSGYTGGNAGKNVALSVSGGFKTGDVITVAGFIKNTDSSKYGTATLFTATNSTGSEGITNIKQFENFANLANSEAIVEQTYTLTADYDLLFLGRYGNTATNLTVIKVVRPGEESGGEEPDPEPATWRDIKADFTDDSFFTSSDASIITAGLKMNEDGSFSRVEASDEAVNAVITGQYHSKQHGISNFSATVKVEGAVKITFGTCAWGGYVTVKNSENTEVVPTFSTNTGACYHNNKTANIVVGYYNGGATTLTIAGGSYVPYFAVEAVESSEIPSTATATFALGESGAEGSVPAAVEVNIGEKITIPANRTLWVEGKTLTAWTDGISQYTVGQEVTVSEDMTLTPIFTTNTVAFADRTAEVTATWDFQQKNGAPVLNYQNVTGFYVTQITVNEQVIDFRLDFDTNNGGKLANGSWQDWAQVNDCTKFTLPTYEGTVYSTFSMNDNSATTFAGETGSFASNVNSYTYNGNASTIDIVISGGSYYRWVKAVYPVPTGGEEPDPGEEEEKLYTWDFTNASSACTLIGGGSGSYSYPSDIDANVKLEVDASAGKFNPRGNDVQVNATTIIKVPVRSKGDVITVYNYRNGSNGVDYTIGAENKTAADVSYEYTVSKMEAQTGYVEITVTKNGYMDKFTLLQVKPEAEGGEQYNNVDVAVEWPFTSHETINNTILTPNNAISVASFEILGSLSTNTKISNPLGTGTRTKDPDNGLSFLTFAGDSDMKLHWFVKPATGLTFTPTQIKMYVQRFGTNKENGVVITAKVGEDETTTLGTYTARRANWTTDDEKKQFKWSEAPTTLVNEIVIDLTAEQQVALTSGEGFHLYAVTGLSNDKFGGFSDIRVYGKANGTIASVNSYALDIAASPAEGGNVTKYPAADEYEEGTVVKLTATENFGYDFVNWTNNADEVVSTDAVFNYTVNANETLTANFQAVDTYELAVNVDGANDYMVSINPAPTVVGGKNMYEAGTQVTLTANQYEGLVVFNNWSDATTVAEKVITMSENIDLTAVYSQSDIIAGWDFYKAGNSGRIADYAAEENESDALSLINTETGATTSWLDKSTVGGGGYESFKGAAVNWNTGASNGDVGNYHWQTKINAEAFTNIKVQFQMLYNYNAYKTYNAEYSLDGENWTNFGSITMNGAKAVATFSETLPAAADNQKDLYIRMLADKTSAVDGAASKNDGNTLAMFFITGTPKLVDDPIAPTLVSAIPSDNATDVSANGKIVLTFDKKVQLTEEATATLGDQVLTPVASGMTVNFSYKGLEYATTYTFTLSANSISNLTGAKLDNEIILHFTTMDRPNVTKELYDAVVENVDQLVAAINEANNRSDKSTRYRIFVKKGEYKLPTGSMKHYTHKSGDGSITYWEGDLPDPITYITGANISFIGENRDATIITQNISNDESMLFNGQFGKAHLYEEINNSAVFQIEKTATGTYFQDITIKSGINDALGRNLAIHDKSSKTIYKNTYLYGYQDTWTSNADQGVFYFEDGIVRGRTDYLCGKGDAFFNGVELLQVGKGGYPVVPSNPANIGWVFMGCTINGETNDVTYTLGRPWGKGTPVAVFIDTKMNIIPDAIGWSEMSGNWPARFAEYNSMTETGGKIDLSGRKTIFAETHENNPVLTAEEAADYSDMSQMFGDWTPTLLTEQAPIPENIVLNDKELSWDGSNYALLYAVCKDGQVIDFTTDSYYLLTEDGTYSVRAANEMGGLSAASVNVIASDISTCIKDVKPGQPAGDIVYTLQGVRVEKAQKGLYIVNGRKAIVK